MKYKVSNQDYWKKLHCEKLEKIFMNLIILHYISPSEKKRGNIFLKSIAATEVIAQPTLIHEGLPHALKHMRNSGYV